MSFTVDALASYFVVNKTTILRWIAAGRFPHAQKERGRWRIPDADMEHLPMHRFFETSTDPLVADMLERLATLETQQLEILIYHQIKTPLRPSDMQRFLVRHHKLPNTVRGWTDVPLTSFTDALHYAQRQEYAHPPQNADNALRECTVSLCICHRLLKVSLP